MRAWLDGGGRRVPSLSYRYFFSFRWITSGAITSIISLGYRRTESCPVMGLEDHKKKSGRSQRSLGLYAATVAP
jgi:hypothetical protein